MKLRKIIFEKNIKISKEDSLIVIDVQNDFIPGGALPVEKGDEIVDGINELIEKFRKKNAIVVLSQDWHPPEHLSFASNHKNKEPGDEFQSNDGAIGPVLWPDHCVQGSNGAEFHKKLKVKLANKIIRKGMRPKIDSYSVFLENDKKTETGLSAYLHDLNINKIFICGLALDYCCFFSAIDGVSFGFETFFILDLTRGIDVPEGNISNAIETMRSKEVKFIKSNDIQ